MPKVLKIFTLFLFVLLLSLLFSGIDSAGTRAVIAVIKSRDIDPYNVALKGFEDVLKEKGIKPSITQYCLYCLQEGREGVEEETIEEVKSLNPDLVLTLGSSATRVAQTIKKIPVVFSLVLDPVEGGFVKSRESSGNNFTGVSLEIPIGDQFQKIISIIPRAKNIGVIYNPGESEKRVKEASKVAKKMGLKLFSVPVKTEKELPGALKNLRKRIDVLWAVPDSIVFTQQSTKFILLFTLREKLPFMGLSPSFVKAGALFAFYADHYEIGRQTGKAAIRILNGKKPSDIPVAFPQKICLAVNFRVAEIIGIKIPPEVRDKADRIFE